MNIVLFTTSLEPSAVTTQIVAFAKHLYQQKHSVIVVCHEHLSAEAQHEYQTLPFVVTSLHCYRWQIWKGICVFKAIQKQYKVDIVHCHLGRAYIIGILSKHKKVRLLATFHNLKKDLTILTRLFISLYYKKFDGITAVSNTALMSYHFNQLKHRDNAIRIIYNPVFLLKENADINICPHQLFDNSFFTIGVINRFVKRKGYEKWFTLVKKMSLRRTIYFQGRSLYLSFWAAGTGILEQVFKKKVVKEKIPHVAFLGHCRDIFALIQQSQLIVYPTVSEGFGLVLYESLLLGVPVLVNPLAVFKELLGKDSLWFVNFDDMAEVQEKIHYFAQNYAKVQEQARKDGEKFRIMLSSDEIFKQYISFYEDCCIS